MSTEFVCGLFHKSEYPSWVQFLLVLIRLWVYIYDFLTYLPFQLFANPGHKLARSERIKAKPLKENDPSSPYRNVECPDGKLLTEEFPGIITIDKLFERSVNLYNDNQCVGTRKILSVDREKQSNGKTFEKYEMGDYEWLTYNDVNKLTFEVGSGLLKLQHKIDEKVLIYSETRQEWIITALSCLRYKIPIVTVITTFEADVLEQAIKDAEPVTIFASQELVKKAMKILPNCPTVKRLIYFESQLPDVNKKVEDKEFENLPNDFIAKNFTDLVELGRKNLRNPPEQPKPDSIAIVMCTSGTTGAPKAVLITHRNVIAALAGQCSKIPLLRPGEVYVAYLPLAHIFELESELGCITHGVRLGYSSPSTLTDQSNKVKSGTKGDLTVLQPTLMAVVPAIANRLYKAVIEKVEQSPILLKALFEFVYELKRSKIEDGFTTPILDKFIFNRIRAVIGGKIRLMLSGSAALNSETQRFMNICFCCPVGQGFGLTETCAAGTMCDIEDLRTKNVGAPLPCNDVLLQDWEEGGYVTSSLPPQGEVLISGANITEGYLNNPKKTEESYIQIDGRKWFRTGDIGQFLQDGSLEIIDRKKDMIKLNGDYVSLNKVETGLLTSLFIDLVCCCGSPDSSFLIALVVPNKKHLESLGHKHGVTSEDFDSLRTNNKVVDAFLQNIQDHARKNKLKGLEIPERVYLCKEKWSVENGLLTDAMEVKRKPINEKYEKELQKFIKEK